MRFPFPDPAGHPGLPDARPVPASRQHGTFQVHLPHIDEAAERRDDLSASTRRTLSEPFFDAVRDFLLDKKRTKFIRYHWMNPSVGGNNCAEVISYWQDSGMTWLDGDGFLA